VPDRSRTLRKSGDTRRHGHLRSPIPQINAHHVDREDTGWTSWFTTTDHKRIGIMYMVTTFVFFILGGVEALIIRLQLGARATRWSPRGLQPAVHDARTTMIFLFVCR